MIRLLFLTDADNTLWDTDSVFRNAQLQLLEQTLGAMQIQQLPDNPLDYLRLFDQAIARQHHRGLRYPPSLLVRAIVLGSSGVLPEKAARTVTRASEIDEGKISSEQVNEISDCFSRNLGLNPKLRAGVLEGFDLLRKSDAEVWIVTEGHKTRIHDLLVTFGLEDDISGILEGQKTAQLYRRMKRRYPNTNTYSMIGDQYDRDVVPAKSEGYATVLFPGGFQPDWVEKSDQSAADIVVESFLEGVEFVLAQAPPVSMQAK